MINIDNEEVMLVVSFIVVLTIVGILVITEGHILDIIYFVVLLGGFIWILFNMIFDKQE